MSNIEHLIENALTAMSKKPSETYQAFMEEMSAGYNQQMLQEVSITEEELWAIAQYIVYTWIPSIEAEPVKHGRWIKRGQDIFCSECGGESKYTWHGSSSFSNYCPNCGAKMDGGSER